MKKYFLAAVLMMAFAGLAGAQTTEKTKTKNGIAKTSVKSPATNTGIKTAGMQTGENKSTVTTKEKTEPNKTKTKKATNSTGKAATIRHHKAKRKPKKKK